MTEQELQARLWGMRDAAYGAFQKKLIPGISEDSIIGVRTPALRSLAKQMIRQGEGEDFLGRLPHRYFDENQLHAFLISEEKDGARCLEKIEAFLPYVDNWATCDQMSPKVLKKHRTELLGRIRVWLSSDHPFVVRFAIGMLMEHFLDEAFEPAYPEMVAKIRSEAYYVNMMIAWYFATALAKQYAAALPYLEEKRLPPWVHQKTIQKAVESDRIPPEKKEYLKSLRYKEKV